MFCVASSPIHHSVSQWKDLHRLGCLFHQGDHIVAVNELQVTSTDEISLFLSRSTRKEVRSSNLTKVNLMLYPGTNF